MARQLAEELAIPMGDWLEDDLTWMTLMPPMVLPTAVGAGREPRYAPELPPPRGERNRKLIADGCIVAAREERLLDIWCRRLQDELLAIDAPVLTTLKGSLDPDRAAQLLVGQTRATTLKRYLGYYRQWRLWLAEAKLRYPPGRPADLVDYLQSRHGHLAWTAKDKITEVWGSLRWSDLQAIIPAELSLVEGRLVTTLRRTKTSGPNRRVRELPVAISEYAFFARRGPRPDFLATEILPRGCYIDFGENKAPGRYAQELDRKRLI
ncbi:unnamed protein product, partial [Symbiodinium sp. KB8]